MPVDVTDVVDPDSFRWMKSEPITRIGKDVCIYLFYVAEIQKPSRMILRIEERKRIVDTSFFE